MSELVYERMVNTRGDLNRHIIDAAAGISDQDALCRVALSVVKQEGSYRS
jgi:hypothetical protein